ncbi:MAG TPA: CHAT domain-containing tetratricopeptide repeat protein [Candidatus Sericytochromatia bacterium]
MLLSLTSTIKLPGTPLDWAVSAQAQTTQEQTNEALRLNKVGLWQFTTGQFREALQTFEQVLGIVKAIGERQGEGTVLNNIGEVYRSLGQYPQALNYHEQSLVIRKQAGDKAGEGTTLNSIGSVYRSLGQYPQALKYYEQSLVIIKEVGDKAVEGTILSNIGNVYNNLGQYTQALKYYEQSLVISKEIGDKAVEGTTLNNIGAVYLSLVQYPQALKYYEQSLVISKEIGAKALEGTTLNNIGSVYRNLGQYPQALKYYEQALVIKKQVGDKAGEGTILNNIGLAYHNLGQYPQALKYYSLALVIHKEVGNKVMEGKTLNNIGSVYNSLGQYTDAEKTLFAAIEAEESLRPGLPDASKIAIFETQANPYRFLQQSLVAQNKTNDALLIAERGRARAFVELLAQRQSNNSNNQLTVKPPTIQQIQQIAKTQNATLVQYSIVYDTFRNQGKEDWRQSSLYIWVVKPTGEVAFKQVDLKSLETPLAELVTNSRDSIGVRSRGALLVVGPGENAQATATERLQQLHQILIQPIAQFLPTDPNSRVIFIPQSSLFLVPFAALQDEQEKYLIEKHTILTAPAIQVLELTHQQRQRLRAQSLTSLQGKDALIVGNPTMPSIPDSTGKLQKLANLPGAETEANAIAKLLNTQAIIGASATKAAILPKLTSARIVHLATHGLLDDFKLLGVPGAIALAPSGNDNGLLTSSEIFDLKLNAELVVLSACDTGRGDIKGDGVVGLSRSLISAGVSSILVSLWSVPDAPTASLMTEFYRQIQQNSDKATSLRSAMLTTMKQHPNPKDWAAFTLIGEAE